MLVLPVTARHCTFYVVLEKGLFNQAIKAKLHPEFKIALDEDSLVVVKVTDNCAIFIRPMVKVVISASYVEVITEIDGVLVIDGYSIKDGKFLCDFSDHREELESVLGGEACSYARGLVDSFPETVEYEPD